MVLGEMRRTAGVRKLIDQHLTAALAPLAFVRERYGMYSMPTGPQVVGITAFPEKLWKDTRWDLYPNVGVRHDEVNRLLSELSDSQEPDRALGLLRANLLTNLGYLTPERRHQGWSFPFDADPEPIVQDLATTIETYGLPFIRALSEPASFRRTLESGRYSLADRDRDLLALYVVQGDDAAAEVQLRESLEKRATRRDPEAEQYRSFAVKIRQRIERRTMNP
jgi:hypothetical protein